MSRACAEVSLSAITHNLKLIKNKTDAQVLAVVKADAYGHGLLPVAIALSPIAIASSPWALDPAFVPIAIEFEPWALDPALYPIAIA